MEVHTSGPIFRALALATALATAADAGAATCPPAGHDASTMGYTDVVASGDLWMSERWCGAYQGGMLEVVEPDDRGIIIEAIVDHMRLFPLYALVWALFVEDAPRCLPASWAGRFFNGAWATELVGIQRDNDVLDHVASPVATLPDGAEVRYWLGQYVRSYTRDNGWVWRCLADGDVPDDDWMVFGSNPDDDGPLKVYYPWFWVASVISRAATLVHEASHEFSGHIGDGQCFNGGSCDERFMWANAQTFDIIFRSQAIDAYDRRLGERTLEVANYGHEVCGYVPFMPDQLRFTQVHEIRAKLNTVFHYISPLSDWPASAFIDPAPGSLYDLADEPGGQAGMVYRVDVVNGARWPCGWLCDESDYTFSPGPGSGALACNEDYQPENAQVNAFNRGACEVVNERIAQGVTPQQRGGLYVDLLTTLRDCIPGVSEAFVDSVCADLRAGAATVDDIEAGWSIPDQGWYFDAEAAIAACQAQWCAGRDRIGWAAAARAACFEWDDPGGCLAHQCGDLAVLAAEHGRESVVYLQAVVCRASALGREVVGATGETSMCGAAFERCLIEDRYLDAWQAQLAGGACWSQTTGVVDGADPLHVHHRADLGSVGVEPWLAADEGPALATSGCFLDAITCEAQAAALAGITAKLVRERAAARPSWAGPPLPDPWRERAGRLDEEIIAAFVSLADTLDDGADPAALADRVERLAHSPEARRSAAEQVGHDLWFAMGGERFAPGVFAPAIIARFTGPNAQADPHGVDLDGADPALVQAVGTMRSIATRLHGEAGRALFDAATGLPPAVWYRRALALRGARTTEALDEALDALEGAVAP
jgi:hypothetical protein